MMRLFPTTLLIVFISSSVSGAPEEIRKLASASNRLGFRLFQQFDSGENVFFCPTSIFIALSMLHQGARGTTAREMQQVLSYDTTGVAHENLNQDIQQLLSSITSSDQYELDISNAMLSQLQFRVRDEYKEILKRYYDAELREVNFSGDTAGVLAEINKWVSNKTRGKIPKLLDSLDPNALLVLLNAVYFKSSWEVEFSPKKTKDATFYNNGVNPVSVRMMSGRERVEYWEDGSSSAVKLPYKGKNVSMVLVLPNERGGLKRLRKEIDATRLEEIVSKMNRIFVTTDIPRFKLEYSVELASALQKLGMSRAFSNGADLSGISEEVGLKVSRIVHKSYVEVNEEGSEAAGATGIEIIPVSYPGPRRYSFKADRPFLFFIIDERTGMILFAGQVNKLVRY